MDGVKGQQVRSGDGIACFVIDMNQLNARSTPEGTKNQTTDSPEAIYAYFDDVGSARISKNRSTSFDGFIASDRSQS